MALNTLALILAIYNYDGSLLFDWYIGFEIVTELSCVFGFLRYVTTK